MTTDTKVFVIYARQDRALADELFRILRLIPVEVWSDDQLRAGDHWQEELRSRLRDTESFVLLLTPQALGSSSVLHELGAAWALGKPIILVVTDRRLVGRLPVDLGKAQTISVDEMDKLEEVLAA